MAEAEAITPRRFALRFDPPTIVLEFEKAGNLFHHKMRLHNLREELVRGFDSDMITRGHAMNGSLGFLLRTRPQWHGS